MFKGELGVIRRYFQRGHTDVLEVHVAGNASEAAEASPEISVFLVLGWAALLIVVDDVMAQKGEYWNTAENLKAETKMVGWHTVLV